MEASVFMPAPSAVTLFAAELYEQLEMDVTEIPLAGHGESAGVRQPRQPAHTYETLASKKPTVKPKASRKRKDEHTGTKLRGTVLVVDDVADVTEMIELLLKHAGYDVSTADSAKGALLLARQKHYDLVISDIGMPEMNGYELATALRELAAYNRTPLIAVTGYPEYDDRGRAVKAGFNVHLTKPIEPTQLLTLMKQLLSQSEPDAIH